MKPLSYMHRLMYLVVLVVLFVGIFPLVLLYASGYRYTPSRGVFTTGGIFLAVPYSSASVYLNGVSVGASSLLTRSFYIDNLTPGIYTIRVSKTDSRSWERALIVETQVVTDAEVLLLPEEITVRRLSTTPSTATTTRSVTALEYQTFANAFKVPSATTTPVSLNSQVVIKNGDVFVRWINPDRLLDSAFCRRPSFCTPEIAIESGDQRSTDAFPFGPGVVYVTKEGGVFFSEIDARSSAVVATLYPGTGLDARVVNGQLIVKDGRSLYDVSF